MIVSWLFLESVLGNFEDGSMSFEETRGFDMESTRTVNHGSGTKRMKGTCFTWSGMHYKSFDGRVYRSEDINQ